MTENAKIGDGDVPITLGGKAYRLVPTRKAVIELCSSGDALVSISNRLLSLDPAMFHRVIAAGIGRDASDLPDLIYDTGYISLREPCMVYISHLGNGGRPLPKVKDAGPGPLEQTLETAS